MLPEFQMARGGAAHGDGYSPLVLVHLREHLCAAQLAASTDAVCAQRRPCCVGSVRSSARVVGGWALHRQGAALASDPDRLRDLVARLASSAAVAEFTS